MLKILIICLLSYFFKRFDVIAKFPPIVESSINDLPAKGRPPVLCQKDDEIRDAFLERFPHLYKMPVNLFESEGASNTKAVGFPSLYTLVSKYKDFNEICHDSEAAMEKTIGWVMNEMQDAKIRKAWIKQMKNLKRHEREGDQVNNDSNDEDYINISDLFRLSENRKEKKL